MLLVITDEGRFWNHENPILEQCGEQVLVVCLNGKPVTDKYPCFVSPYMASPGMGMVDFGIGSAKYDALRAVAEALYDRLSGEREVVFLADNKPEGMYPYAVLAGREARSRWHLWCMRPFNFEGKRRRDAYLAMLEDLSGVRSLVYLDERFVRLLPREDRNFRRIFEATDEYCAKLFPKVLAEIRQMNGEGRYWYDCSTGGFAETYGETGLEPDKRAVERAYPRADGKAVCEKLKQMRKALAEANGIDYQPVDCPAVGPCAGTCPQCEEELRMLRACLERIPPEARVYPPFSVEKAAENRVPVENNGDEPFTTGIIPLFRGVK